MELAKRKQVEIDGPPPTGEYVWVDCGAFRCLGFLNAQGEWRHANGRPLKKVVGYFPVTKKGSAAPKTKPVSRDIAWMELPKTKRIETDGPPPADQPVLIDCGTYRCLGLFTSKSKWVDTNGRELQNVVGYSQLAG